MYCPNCAAPIDGVKFCRSCGSNVSLVPQAMSGQLPQADDAEGKRRWRHPNHRERWEGRPDRKKEPGIDGATTSVFSGIGFLLAAMFICFYFPGGFTWGWAFLFPGFSLIGKGVGQYLRLKEQERKQASFNQPVVHQGPAQAPALSAPTTSELVKPSSVTEHTTKRLE
jgi:hypothetical protein